MAERLHLVAHRQLWRFRSAEFIEHLADKLIRLGENRNIHGWQRLMIHTPTIGSVVIDGAMNYGFCCGLLRLRLAQTQAQHTGKIEPI